jgi:alanine racemase
MIAELRIDLDAVAANWRTLCGVHAAPVAAVVKAQAYGLGAVPVARRLYAEGVRQFFVGHVEEGLELRPHVPGAMIAVLNGYAAGEAGAFSAHGLTAVLGSLGEIAAYRAHGRAVGRALPAMLHVDTGMNRLGLPAGEFSRLAEDSALLGGLDWLYVMTHLVSAEVAGDAVNGAQAARFAAARARLPAMRTSVANSSGIFLGSGFRSDLARPGAALYGLNPTPAHPNPMRPVFRLTAPVVQLREIGVGETVGYNATWAAARPSRVATVALGYADGYLRGASNRAQAAYVGQRLPLIGRVSMDLLSFDATDVAGLAVGSRLELIGPAVPPDEVGAAAGSNGYEILTSLGHRAARVFGAL